MVQYRPLVGEDAPLDAATALAMRLPASGPSGHPWHFSRAELPHSLPSELRAARGGERMTLASYVEHLIRLLDPKLKGTPGRPPLPSASHFQRGLEDSERNPADHVALGHVAKLVAQSRGPVRLQDAVDLYVRVRTAFLDMVKQHHYRSLRVPAYNSSRQHQLIRTAIRSELAVMSFPYLFRHDSSKAGAWHYALLPDVPSVETDAAVRMLGMAYKALAVERSVRGGLSQQQLYDLKAIVPTGMPPLLQYLVVTLTNQATCRALGITDGVARSVRMRFDALTLRELPKLRPEAERHALQKLVKTSGRQVKDLERAINNRLRTVVNERQLLRDPHQLLVRQAVGQLLKTPDVIAALRDIAHNFSASFKGASGNTPEDAMYIERLGTHWRQGGSQTERILHLFNMYLLHRYNRTVGKKTMRALFKLADIKCVKSISSRDPSDAQYWARRGLKSVKQLFIALSMCERLCEPVL